MSLCFCFNFPLSAVCISATFSLERSKFLLKSFPAVSPNIPRSFWQRRFGGLRGHQYGGGLPTPLSNKSDTILAYILWGVLVVSVCAEVSSGTLSKRTGVKIWNRVGSGFLGLKFGRNFKNWPEIRPNLRPENCQNPTLTLSLSQSPFF